MEEQIVSAVNIAFDHTSSQALKSQAFEYVNSLRQEPALWQPCLTIFLRIPREPDVVRTFCLDVVNNAVRAGMIDGEGLKTVKDRIMTYLEQEYTAENDATGVKAPDSSATENKLAQTMTYLFCALYTNTWMTCFDDLLSLTKTKAGNQENLLGAIFYFRVLNSIHDEIGDTLLSRSRPEQDQANMLKDLIRARDVQKIAASWLNILGRWRTSNATIADLTMKTIGRWVTWIDISLVVNENMMRLLFEQIEQAQKPKLEPEEEKAMDSAVSALTEIVGKKMPASDKINLISFLDLQNVVHKLGQCPRLGNPKASTYDVDLAELVAKLVTTAVQDLIKALENEQQSSDLWQKAEHILQAFLPGILRYFADEYDEVCSTILPAMSDLLSFIRRAMPNDEDSSRRTVMLLPILTIIFSKMRYDDIHDYGEEEDGTDEAEFQDLRKRLSSLQQSIAIADQRLFIDAVSSLVTQILAKFQMSNSQLTWRDIDLALQELYMLGDLAVKSGGLYQKNKPNSPAGEKVVELMLVMVESNVGSYNHPAIQIQYMEICVRFSSFFDRHTQHIQTVMRNFLQLAHSSNLKVRSRNWYLLQRFVRQQRQNAGGAAEFIIPSIQDLLTIKAELPAEGDGESSDGESTTDGEFASQLYLFETVGTVISAGSLSAEKQVDFIQMIMQPLFTDIQTNLSVARNNKLAVLQIHHDIMALGNVARGYFDWPGSNPLARGPVVPDGVKAAFGRVSEVTLVALGSLKTSFDIRTAARFAFSRLIGMVGQQMMQQLPQWVDGLLTESSTRDEMAQFLRLLDQITFGFKNDIFDFLDSLFTGLLQRVFAGISATASGTDDEIELAELKREYLNFLLVILGNDLGAVLVSTTNQPFFETVIGTIEHFAKDPEDAPTAKMALSVLARMCTVWGGPDVVTTPGQQQNAAPTIEQSLPGFKQFMIQRFSPLCWALPSNPSFNPKDGQSRQTLSEAAGLQKVIYSKTGQEYLTWLKNNELPGVGLQGQMLEEFLSQLATSDIKGWKGWFTRFVIQGGTT